MVKTQIFFYLILISPLLTRTVIRNGSYDYAWKQSGYIKVDAYLLNLVYHVISDANLSYYFLLIKVKNMFLTLESFRKQYQSIKQKLPLCQKQLVTGGLQKRYS